MPEDRGMLRPDESAGVKDDDFVIESFSAPNAFTETPADTTDIEEPPKKAAPSPVADVVVDEGDEPPVADSADADDPGQQSQSRLGKTADPVATAKKNKKPLDKRTSQLQHEVATLTHAKHRTRTELDADEKRLADVRREIADLEAKRSGAPPAREPVRAPATSAAEAAMPEHPKYRDFETDEAYEAAVAKWRTEDVPTWQTAREQALEQRITQGVDSRFRGADSEAAQRAAERRVVSALQKVRDGKPDWNEKAANLKDVTSSWYDPEKHGDQTTPFLTDLARTRMAMGQEDGAELLYFLAEDPDRAQVLADLLPNRPIRDAIVHAPSALVLLEHFATENGQRDFEALKQMHPIRANQAIGALSARLAGASSGSLAQPHPITQAHPSARPPAGTPGARGSGSPPGKQSFEDWMKSEDDKELVARKRALGIAG